MTAGRGIVHAEMPGHSVDGVSSNIVAQCPVKSLTSSQAPNVGLQLWVDLPKHLKYCEPRYRDLHASEVPTATADDNRVTIKVISGISQGVESAQELAYTPVWILDVTMKPGGKLSQPLPKGWNAFAYTLEGDQMIFGENTKVGAYHNVVFAQTGDGIEVLVPDNAESPARFGESEPS